MDWDLKMPASWDLADLAHDAVPAIAAPAPAVAASSIAVAAPAPRGPPSRPECSVDLKLGGLGDFGAGAMKEPAARAPVAVPVSTAAAVVPSASPLKRPRPGAGGGAGHCPSCAVDGCKADLSRCRDYHRRHKVCEAHSKTPLVVVAGREMRFCQQCSRFHLLGEFDEAKRSCRKRLDGHNRRRRKPQVDSMNSGSFMATQQGTRFASSFPAPRPEQSWSGIIKTEDTNPYYTTHHHQVQMGSSRQNFAGSTSSSYSKEEGGGRRFPFLHEGEQLSFSTGLEIPVCQPLLKAAAVAPPPPPPESSSSNNNKMFSDGRLIHHMLDSDCALSLLSSPANSSSVVVDVSRMVRPTEHVPSSAAAAQQHLVPNLQQFGSSSWFACSQASSPAAAAGFAFPGMESEQLNTALVPGSNDNDMNCHHGIFHVGAEGSSDGTSPSLQFAWQ